MVVDSQTARANGSSSVTSKRYAVVVGINDYSGSDAGNLSFCAADAEAFYDALITYCEYDASCVTLFSDGAHEMAHKPSRSDILVAIATMSTNATDQDSILFYFSGHGTRDTRDSYLITKEFRREVVAETSIPMGTINEHLHNSDAKFVMRFFDACHAGRVGTRGTFVGPDIQKHFLVEADGWTTLSACREDELAYEVLDLGHGIFSYCLVKGLSGDAATPEQEVTLHSLTTYTISKTSEITKERGYQQTPVADGYQAGNLVLATIRSIPSEQVPPALVKVEKTTIDELKPTPERVPQMVDDIRAILQDDPLPLEFVASNQAEKLARGEQLIARVYEWCQEQERQYHQQLDGLVTITVKYQSLQTCPLNRELAEYINKSKIDPAVALEFLYKTEQVEMIPQSVAFSFYKTYQTHKTLEGVSERQGYYMSAVELRLSSKSPLMPVCAMVIAIIPGAFGLYLLRYTCASELDQVQKEQWDSSTFLIRTLHALPFADEDGTKLLEELHDIFPQLVSFFSESCAARKLYLKRMGITGQSLL